MTRLIRSELLKIRTTHIWWILALSAFAFVALSFLIQAWATHDSLQQPGPVETPPDMPADQAERFRQQQAAENQAQYARAHSAGGLAAAASNLYTSGQYFGLLFVMLLAILMITNEYRHQTVTATFLVTPRRTNVVVAKLLTAMLAAFLLWLATTVINVTAGAIFFATEHVPNSLGHRDVRQAIALNLLAYALWAVLGVGLGTLIRSQIGATVTASALYLIGTQAATAIVFVLYTVLDKAKWVPQLLLFIPSFASQYMASGGDRPGFGDDFHLWPRWSAALILVGYGVVAGAIGTLILRRRDVS
jgi:ABC-type transport system involved in multi-copper enzyme maturation permease subunit